MKVYTVTTQSKYDYDFSVVTLKHGAFFNKENALKQLLQEIKKFKTQHKDDKKEYTNKEYYQDESDGAWTECTDLAHGYWCVDFGFEERHECHQICIDEFDLSVK
jgi:hypothetical protein